MSKINIYTGEEINLLSYNIFNLSIESLNYTCSICYSNNIVYVGIIKIINNTLEKNFIKIELDETIVSNQYYENEANEDNQNESNEIIESNQYNSNEIILVNYNDKNETIVKNQTIYSFDYLLPIFTNKNFTRQISCEIISPTNSSSDEALVCGYIKYNNSTLKYSYMVGVLNSHFNQLDSELNLTTPEKLLFFRLQKINSTYIRYLITANSFEINIMKNFENSKFKLNVIPKNARNEKLYSFYSFNDLFYYHNQHIFSSTPTDSDNINHFYLIIKSNTSDSYLRFTLKNTYIHKIIGYYNDINDKFLFFYQFYNKIRYYTVENISILYDVKFKEKTEEVLSNTTSTFNASELITSPSEHELLHLSTIVVYETTISRRWSYDKKYFNETSQVLTVFPSLNDWVYFYFYFIGEI